MPKFPKRSFDFPSEPNRTAAIPSTVFLPISDCFRKLFFRKQSRRELYDLSFLPVIPRGMTGGTLLSTAPRSNVPEPIWNDCLTNRSARFQIGISNFVRPWNSIMSNLLFTSDSYIADMVLGGWTEGFHHSATGFRFRCFKIYQGDLTNSFHSSSKNDMN